ncbi:MAG: transcriptional repressor [Candidatus Anstonellales archaeon]
MKQERLTIQKKTILDYLKNTKIHPDGETVYLEVKKSIPNISRGTVYRILNQLQEKGDIQVISLDKAHFDGDTSFHIHFVCENCHKIYDLPANNKMIVDFKKILTQQKIKVDKINNIQILIYGKCKQCS